jgi:hypothetical protein
MLSAADGLPIPQGRSQLWGGDHAFGDEDAAQVTKGFQNAECKIGLGALPWGTWRGADAVDWSAIGHERVVGH